MKATLIKENDFYYLVKDNKIIAEINGHPLKSITGKLSKQNCDEIFGIITSEALMKDITSNCDITKEGFILGFQVAMELNKDKLFTEDDVNLAFVLGKNKDESRIHKLINSKIRPTEVEVEIEMKRVVDETQVTGSVKGVKGSGDKITTYKSVPKLDENWCLMLKNRNIES